MAGEEGLDERTEEASQKRRDDWRSEGRIAQSKDLASALLLLSVTGALYGSAGWVLRGLSDLFESSLNELSRVGLRDLSIEQVRQIGTYFIKAFFLMLAPVAGICVMASVAGSLLQFGFLWTTKPLEPSFDKLNPMTGLTRIFSLDGLFEFFKALAKFVVVGSVAYLLLRKWTQEAGLLWDFEVPQISHYLVSHLAYVLFAVGGSMFVISALDYGFQKFRYEQKIKMTRQESREERKQQDGNPQVKARIRGIQRKFANSRMLDAVKKADVVITNPTHFAIALVYDRETMFAPKVVAKGADYMALRIKEIARANGVPCIENPPLARALFKALKIGQFISRDLFKRRRRSFSLRLSPAR